MAYDRARFIATKVLGMRGELCNCTHDELIDTLAMILGLHVGRVGWPLEETLERFASSYRKAHEAGLKRIPARRGNPEESKA